MPDQLVPLALSGMCVPLRNQRSKPSSKEFGGIEDKFKIRKPI